MKLALYLRDNELWAAIQTAYRFPFIADHTPAIMDTYLDIQYGQRCLYEGFEGRPVNTVAALIVAAFQEKWLAQIEGADRMGGALTGRAETTTESLSNNEVKSNTQNAVNKVSSFNSNDLIDNDGSTSEMNDTLLGEKDRTQVKQIVDVSEIYKNLDLMTKNGIMNSVTKDVALFLTLSIY